MSPFSEAGHSGAGIEAEQFKAPDSDTKKAAAVELSSDQYTAFMDLIESQKDGEGKVDRLDLELMGGWEPDVLDAYFAGTLKKAEEEKKPVPIDSSPKEAPTRYPSESTFEEWRKNADKESQDDIAA